MAPTNKSTTARTPKALKAEATTVPLTLRIPASLKAKLLKLANADGRTLNNWILQQLKQAAK